MNLTAEKKWVKSMIKQILFLALIFCLSTGFCGIAHAQSSTTLTVLLKGITYDGENGWRSVTLSAPFRVLTMDEQLLGEVTAGAKPGGQESDTLKLSGVTELLLQPMNAEATPDFVFAGNSRVAVTEGNRNLTTVFAYAKQGFFIVKSTIAGTGAVAPDTEFVALDQNGEVCDSFTLDETGSYRSSKLLPDGEYKLVEMQALEGMQPLDAPISFTIGTYFGNEEDVAVVNVELQPIASVPPSAGSAANQSQTTPGNSGISGQPQPATEGIVSAANAKKQPLDATAETGTALRGSVIAAGVPVSDVIVALATPDGKTDEQATDSEGRFVFADALGKKVTLTVTPPPGMAVMTLNGEAVNAVGGYRVELDLTTSAANEQHFELAKAASITGKLPDAIKGETISAVSMYAKVSAQTHEDGSFRFDGLALGDYSIYIPLPEGKTLVADSAWRVTKQKDMLWVTVSLQKSGEHALPVPAFQTLTSIEGCAYVDANGDLIYNEGEQLMTGVPVALQRANGDTWEDVADTKTDEYGKYNFQSLASCDYRVASETGGGELFVAAVGGAAQSVADSGVMCSATISLADGASSKGQADISLQAAASLRFASFNDANGDGMQGGAERVIGGIKAEVMDGEAVIVSGITDAGGIAKIDGVRPGSYALRITLPGGVAFAAKGAAPEAGQSCVSAADSSGSIATSGIFSFVGGQTVTTGVGVKDVGSFSGKVFEDMNNNGVMDEGEPGVPGIVLHLAGKRTGETFEFTTDETGLYRFAAVPDDSYELTATLPEGMLFARYSKTGGDLRSLFSGSIVARQFTVRDAAQVVNKNIGVIEKGGIAGHVFLDVNYNGVLDEGEPGFAGVTLEAIKLSNSESVGKTVSDKNGNYLFEGLRGGDYRLRAILPDDGTIFTVVPATTEGKVNLFSQNKSRRENSIQPVSIESGNIADTLVGVAVGATVTGSVFQDADYNGSINGKEKKLSGIKVQMVDEQGVIVATDITKADGKYSMTGIMPGSYQVKIQRKPAFGFTRLRPDDKGGSHVAKLEGEFGSTAIMSIAMGETIADVNAGMLPASTVTGMLFHDEDDDGLQSEGEQGMLGASVRLLSEDSEIDLIMQIGVDGKYFFDGVMPGKYTLTYILPKHSEMARVAQGGNTVKGHGLETTSDPFSIEMGEAYQYQLAGAVTLGNFSGYVFHDINGNGVADDGEERMAGAAVTLTPDRASAKEESATSGTDGGFDIVGLRPAEYKLTVKLSDGYVFSHDLVTDGLSFDTVRKQTADCSWRILTSRAEKTIGAVRPATVSGVIWLDENKDSSQGNGEMLMADVNLELVDESTNGVVKRTASTARGFTFDQVRPGSYTVRFALPSQSEFAMDKASTFVPEGLYMQSKNVVVTEGAAVTGLMTGLVSKTSIGGKLRMDENGESAPIAGVTVLLFMGGDTTPLQTAVTGEDGNYRFDGLWPADYYLQAGLPSGLVFIKPNDPNYQAGDSVISATGDGVGTSEMFYLQMAQHMLDQNIIYIKPARVGDLVWLDANKNGLVDGEEPRIAGVQISLLLDGAVAYQTTSDAYGYYFFDDVYPGTYILQATAYPELGIAKQVPSLRIISSCLISGDGTSAQSEPFAVISGSKNLDNDLGYAILDGQTMPPSIVSAPVRDFTVKTVVKEKK